MDHPKLRNHYHSCAIIPLGLQVTAEVDNKESLRPLPKTLPMSATRVIMHQIVLPSEVDLMGICFGGQVITLSDGLDVSCRLVTSHGRNARFHEKYASCFASLQIPCSTHIPLYLSGCRGGFGKVNREIRLWRLNESILTVKWLPRIYF